MNVERNKTTVHRLFDEIWNGRQFEAIDELYASDFVADYRPYAPLRVGRDAVRDMVERAYLTCPDYHEELLAMVAEGDTVAVHLRISGTQLGAWGPIPPTGKRLEFDQSGLDAVASLAIERETGVRALRSILEGILLDLLYELPARKDMDVFVVNEDVVRGNVQLARGLTAADLEQDDDEDEAKRAGERESA